MKIAIYSPDGSKGWNIVNPKPNAIWVWLDERKVDGCVAADDVAGEVWVHATGLRGEYLLNDARDAILLDKRTGKVEIRMLQS